MTLLRSHVRSVLDAYVHAWTTQDPDLIVQIFTPSATYHERVLGEPIRGRDGIRDYWQRKVVESQAEIECRVLNVYVDGDTAIAEWHAEFDDLEDGVRKTMREVAILEFDGDLIRSLREYWATEAIGPSTAGRQRGR